MTIFEIDEAILNCVDMETGEIVDPEALDALSMERSAKIEGVAMWKKDCDAQAAAIGEEIKKLQCRKKACENRAESLKGYLLMALGGQKFKTPRVAVSYRTTDSVIVDDMKQLGEKYLRFKDPEPDKVAIGAAIKDGIDVKGAHLEPHTSIIIK